MAVQFDHPNFGKWKERVVYEIPPWAWRTDPYCEGMTEETFNYLINHSREEHYGTPSVR